MIRLLARLIERLHPSASHPDSHVVAFARGLTLGALVGAAIAGLSIRSIGRAGEAKDRADGDVPRG